MKKLITVVALFLAITTIACEKKKGSAEKAGEKIDQKLDDAGDKIKEKLNDAGDKIEDKTDKK